MVDQIRADFGTLEQLEADQVTHAANVQAYKDTLRSLAQEALANLDGGLGTVEHEACMKKIDELIDEHITTTQTIQRSTGATHDTFLQGGQQARSALGRGV